MNLAALVPASARIVAVAGPVAVGKSTFARRLAQQLEQAGRGPAQVVSTDGFLFPNHVLEARGLIDRKGFPESYDVAAVEGFITAVRTGQAHIAVPEYSHSVFDVVAGRTIGAPQVGIIEGVNALQPDIAALADVSIYLDAPTEAVIDWYVERFVQLTRQARATGDGFYVRFASLDDAGVAQVARGVWDAINGPNLDHHIRPCRAYASVVVTKGPDHAIVAVDQVGSPPLGTTGS